MFSMFKSFCCFQRSLGSSYCCFSAFSICQTINGLLNKRSRVEEKLYRQIWLGAGLGVLICIIIGGAFIGTFYGLGKDIWGKSEDLWEGIFCIIATVLITAMGIPMLRINKMKEKWRVKLAQALIKSQKIRRTDSNWDILGKSTHFYFAIHHLLA